MEITGVLKEIALLYESDGREDIEKQRCLREISKVRDRLRVGDYKIHSFSENTHNVLERVRDAFAEFEFYCRFGKSWKGIFSFLRLTNADRVISLCPGYAPKAELGLVYLQYGGEMLLVNRDDAALDQLEKFLVLFQPAFRYTRLTEDFFSGSIPAAACVVANHMLDDLLLDRYCTERGIAGESLYEEEGAFVKVWEGLLQDWGAYQKRLVDDLTERIPQLVAPEGYFATSQYESYVERILGLSAATAACRQLLGALKESMLKRGFEDLSQKLPALPEDGAFKAADCLILRRVA